MSLNQVKLESRDKFSLLKNHPAFSRLRFEIIREIAQTITCHHYDRNQIVFVEYETQSCMYIVKAGEFNMSKRVLQCNQVFNYLTKWKYYEICILERGETFGIELIDAEPLGFYKYTVKCHSVDGLLYSIQLAQIQQVFQHNYLKLSVTNLFSYQAQLTKNKLYLLRESQMNNLYRNINQPLQHRRINSQRLNILHTNSPNRRSISCDISYCDKIQSLINYQKQVLENPRRMIKTEVLDDDSYINQSVNNHIKALKPFITNFDSGKQILNSRQKLSVQSVDRMSDLSQNEKIFKMKVMKQLGVRPKKQLKIILHQLQSSHLQKMFPFNAK